MNTDPSKEELRTYIPRHTTWTIPNPYNIPIHDQGDENSCTTHSFASVMEYELSALFKERVEIDTEDLWMKQRAFGGATELGDSLEGPWDVCEKYGIKFYTNSGKHGTFYSKDRIEFDSL